MNTYRRSATACVVGRTAPANDCPWYPSSASARRLKPASERRRRRRRNAARTARSRRNRALSPAATYHPDHKPTANPPVGLCLFEAFAIKRNEAEASILVKQHVGATKMWQSVAYSK